MLWPSAHFNIAIVMNVEVEIVSDTSVRVSWDSVDIPEITGYKIYYNQTRNRSEESITVPSSNNSVVIEGLLNNMEYQFQLVAIAELDGDLIMGQRSILNKMTIIVVVIPTSKYYLLLTDLIHSYTNSKPEY